MINLLSGEALYDALIYLSLRNHNGTNSVSWYGTSCMIILHIILCPNDICSFSYIYDQM